MDEENILLALHAGRHSRAKLFTKVNRVNFEEAIASMPIGKVIRPKQTTAELISQYTRAMQNSMGSNVETLHQLDGAEALRVPRSAAHHLHRCSPAVYADYRPDVLLCCINRRGKRIIPRGHDVLHEGDTVIVVSTFEGMNDLQDIFLPDSPEGAKNEFRNRPLSDRLADVAIESLFLLLPAFAAVIYR